MFTTILSTIAAMNIMLPKAGTTDAMIVARITSTSAITSRITGTIFPDLLLLKISFNTTATILSTIGITTNMAASMRSSLPARFRLMKSTILFPLPNRS